MFETVRSVRNIELREYPSLLVVETEVQEEYGSSRTKAFRRLFNYISGQNHLDEEISMTTPVLYERVNEEGSSALALEESSNRWKMSFLLPEGYSCDSAPRPTSSLVTLKERPASRVATIRFNGSRSSENYYRWTQELMGWIKEQGLSVASAPRRASYDPPWTLPMYRRNEIHVDIK